MTVASSPAVRVTMAAAAEGSDTEQVDDEATDGDNKEFLGADGGWIEQAAKGAAEEVHSNHR